MSGDLDLEQRYRRVLRLLPGYYRRIWEQDMVAAFLESSLMITVALIVPDAARAQTATHAPPRPYPGYPI